MEIEKTVDDKVAVLRCEGRLTMVSAPHLRSAVEECLSGGQHHVVVDLGDTSFVDSSGLGALVNGLKSARVAGGDLRVAGAPEQVRSVLKLTNLDRVLRPYDSVEEARRDW